VYFTTNNYFLQSVDINSHTEAWTRPTLGLVTSSPAAWVGGNGMVIVADANHNVTAYDDDDGHIVWTFKAGGLITAAPAVDTATGRVLIGSHDKKMYSLDANSGAKIWEFDSGGYITSAAVVQAGNIYFATDGGSFYGLDRNKNKLWDPPAIVESVTGSPIMNVSTGLFFIRGYRSLYLLNPNAKQRAYLFTAEGVISDPSLGPNGLVVFGSWDGNVYAMR
jgi:eukaryotic-like serine/threonine-protein kinase